MRKHRSTSTPIHGYMRAAKAAPVAILLTVSFALTGCGGDGAVSFPDPVFPSDAVTSEPVIPSDSSAPIDETPVSEPDVAAIEVEPAREGEPGGFNPEIGQKNKWGDQSLVPSVQDDAAVRKAWLAADPRVLQNDLVGLTFQLQPPVMPPIGWMVTPSSDGTGSLSALRTVSVSPGDNLTVVVGQDLRWSDGDVTSVGNYLLEGDAIVGGTGYGNDISSLKWEFKADAWGPLVMLAVKPGQSIVKVNGKTAVINVIPPTAWKGE